MWFPGPISFLQAGEQRQDGGAMAYCAPDIPPIIAATVGLYGFVVAAAEYLDLPATDIGVALAQSDIDIAALQETRAGWVLMADHVSALFFGETKYEPLTVTVH